MGNSCHISEVFRKSTIFYEGLHLAKYFECNPFSSTLVVGALPSLSSEYGAKAYYPEGL
jgi:hypothetical protein